MRCELADHVQRRGPGPRQTVDEVGALWDKLAAGATVIEAYGPARWAPAFGIMTDRFGITWILDVTAPHPDA
ncbi:hypothetical protein [Micromonospora sp. NPDC049891]|uniref:hypothetical protein n=1 Tax=Micromonospora sp. NPDC049891 TaxID=3155655 RepID=UPI0034011FB9